MAKRTTRKATVSIDTVAPVADFVKAADVAQDIYRQSGSADEAARAFRDFLLDSAPQSVLDMQKNALTDVFDLAPAHKSVVVLPAMRVERSAFDIGLTAPEEYAVLTLREWTRAQSNPYLLARLKAWDDLRHYVELRDKEIQLQDKKSKKARKEFLLAMNKKQRKQIECLYWFLRNLTHEYVPTQYKHAATQAQEGGSTNA